MKIYRYTDAAFADEIRRFDRRAEASDAVQGVVANVIAEIRQRIR